MYRYEYQLADDFVSKVKSIPFPDLGRLRVSTEFFYVRGRADVIGIGPNGKVVAFEIKLKRWKNAVYQAYRNLCFAHYSYVVLPDEVAIRIMNSSDELSNLSLGLCYLSNDGSIQVLIEAKPVHPLQPWLTERAVAAVLEAEKNARVVQTCRSC